MPDDYNFDEIHDELVTRNNYEEFRTVCAKIKVPFDDLGGEGLSAKIRETILLLARQKRLHVLTPYAPNSFSQHTFPSPDDSHSTGVNQPGEDQRNRPTSAVLDADSSVQHEQEDAESVSNTNRHWIERFVLLLVGIGLLGFIIGVIINGNNDISETQFRLIGFIVALTAGIWTGFLGGSFGLSGNSIRLPIIGSAVIWTRGAIGVFIFTSLLWQAPIALLKLDRVRPGPTPTPIIEPTPADLELVVRSLPPYESDSEVYSLSFNSSGNLIVASREPRELFLWRFGLGQSPEVLSTRLISSSVSMRSISFHPNGETILAGDTSGKLWVWSDSKTVAPTQIQSHTGPIYGIYASDDGKRIVTTGKDKGGKGVARLWQFGEKISKIDDYLVSNLGDQILGISPDLTSIAIDNRKTRTIQIRSLLTKELIRDLEKSNLATESGGAFTSDGNYFVAGDQTGTLHLWDTRTGKLKHSIGSLDQSVSSVGITLLNGVIVAVAGYVNGRVSIRYGSDFKLFEPSEKFADNVYCIAFSSDSSLLAAGSKDGKIHIWRLFLKNL